MKKPYPMKKRYQEYGRSVDKLQARKRLLERFLVFTLATVGLVALGIVATGRERSREKRMSRSTLVGNTLSGKSDVELQFAEQFLSDEDYGAAIATYDKILSNDPTQTAALVGRGIAKGSSGSFESAIEDLQAASRTAEWSEAIQLNLGCLYTSLGDVDQAELSYASAINANTDSIEGYANRARCHFNQGRSEDAIADLSEAIRLAPEDPVLRANRAIALSQAGQKDMAASDMALAAKSSDSKTIEFLLALMQLEAGQANECLATTKRALERDPNAEAFQVLAGAAIEQLAEINEAGSQQWDRTFRETVQAFQLTTQRLKDVRQSCKELKSRFIAAGYCRPKFVALEQARLVPSQLSESVAREAHKQAMRYANDGDFHTAIALLNDALRHEPGDHRSRRLRTMLLIGTGQLGHAENALGELTRDYPDDEELQTLLAMVHSRLGQYESSISALNHAVRIQSSNPVVFANRAMVRFIAKDDYVAVVKDCERAERLGLQTAKQFELHARAAAKLRDFDSANRYHQKAIEMEPANAVWLCSQCETFLLQSRLDDALLAADQALLLTPDDGRAMVLRATCLFRKRDFKRAAQTVRIAKSSGVGGPPADILLARLLFKEQDYAASRDLVVSAVTTESNADEQAFRAECHYRNQDYESAWQWIQRAIEKDSREGRLATDKKKLLLASMIEGRRGNAKNAYDLRVASVGDSPTETQSLRLASVAQEAGLWKESLSWLGKLLVQEQKSPGAWHYAGVAFEKIDRPMDAVKCYSQAIDMEAGFVKSRLGRARVFVSQQNYRQAMRDLHELEKNSFDSPDFRQLRSACQLMSSSSR